MANTIQNKLATQQSAGANKPATLKSVVKSMEGEIARALPSTITPERFSRMIFTAISTNPKLEACTQKSFLGAMMTAAQLGLEIGGLGQAYLVPYKNKGVDEVQFQIGYQGLIDLAYRSGEVEVIQAHIVYENDTFEYQYGLEPKLVHIPADKDRGNMIKAYAMFKTKDGGFGFEVMSIDEIKKHAEKYSKSFSYSSSPWRTNFEEMAKKTVLKKVLKYAPKKTELARELAQDETIKTEITDDMSEVPDETVYEVEYAEVDPFTGEVEEAMNNEA